MTGWTPLFQQIVGSSIWSASDHVRIAWITMLAVADKHGVAALTVGGLSALARISREQAEDAFNVLSGPDPDTLTQEYEGRRIERVKGGWKLLNWEEYRQKAKAAIIQEHNREAQARFREKQKTQPNEPASPVAANNDYHPDAISVLEHLNKESGRSFRQTDKNLEFISARLKEPGVDQDGCKAMISRQCSLWENQLDAGGKPMAEYLRPETLFNKTKFDSYYAARDLPINNTSKPNAKNIDHNQMPEDIDMPAIEFRNGVAVKVYKDGRIKPWDTQTKPTPTIPQQPPLI